MSKEEIKCDGKPSLLNTSFVVPGLRTNPSLRSRLPFSCLSFTRRLIIYIRKLLIRLMKSGSLQSKEAIEFTKMIGSLVREFA